jgi:(p)ppGpp synthase/HD superfamily hydrolase
MISEHYPETDIIITAILHDVIEDTEATQQAIEDEFGAEIAQNVELLTRNKSQGKITAEDIILNLQSKGMQKLAILKIMDRMHNLMTISAKSEIKQKKIIDETLRIFMITAVAIDSMKLSGLLYKICNSLKLANSQNSTQRFLLQDAENLLLRNSQPLFPVFQNDKYQK